MLENVESLFQPSPSMNGHSATALLFTLLVSFIIGQMNAWCYKWSHRGISYSRSFSQAMVVITIVSGLSAFLILSNLLAAFGLLGGLAIIRFRTVVRDARDNAYVLMCLVCGMATGLGYVGAALLGAVAVNLTAIYMHQSGFGAWHATDSLLRFEIDASGMQSDQLGGVISRFCRRYSIVSTDEVRIPGSDDKRVFQCVYKVRLRDPEKASDLVSELRAQCPIEAVHLLVDQENEEVA